LRKGGINECECCAQPGREAAYPTDASASPPVVFFAWTYDLLVHELISPLRNPSTGAAGIERKDFSALEARAKAACCGEIARGSCGARAV
jgi:hypothetical protein